MIFLGVLILVYIASMLVGCFLILGTPMDSLINTGEITVLPAEMIGGVFLILLSIVLLWVIIMSMVKRMDEAKEAFLAKHKLVLDERITLRHEKNYEDVPLRLISITLPGKLEFFTDICTIEVIEDTWEAYIFDIPENYTVVLRHKRSKEWEAYSQA